MGVESDPRTSLPVSATWKFWKHCMGWVLI